MNEKTPRMMTVRQVAKTGLLSEYALRTMLREGKLPAIFVGNKALINYDMLCEQMQNLEMNIPVVPKNTADAKEETEPGSVIPQILDVDLNH